MVGRIILLSGPISSGKSNVGEMLASRSQFVRFKTNQLIKTLLPDTPDERAEMQAAGEKLDRQRGGQWLCDALVRQVSELAQDASIAVDAVRTKGQIDAIRTAYGHRVLHVHLTASKEALSKRYARRKKNYVEYPEYEEVRKSRTERNVSDLTAIADVVINTSRCTENDVYTRLACRVNTTTTSSRPLVDVLVGGQYGSEGKGHIASYLARE